MRELLTTKEVAEEIGVSPRQVRFYIESNQLKSLNRGKTGHYLIPRDSLDKFLGITSRSRRKGPSAEQLLKRAAEAGASLGFGPPGLPDDL